MAGQIQNYYPSGDTTQIAINCNSLAASSTLVAGRESAIVTNSANVDVDHLVSGKIAVQSHGTSGRIEVWAHAPISISGGTPSYGKLAGADQAITFDSRQQAAAHGKLLWAAVAEASVVRSYFMPPTSLAKQFGELPINWGLYVINGHGQALSVTSTDCVFYYHRVQKQYT